MATVVSARIAFRKTVQPRDYESETAEVEFGIDLADEDDSVQAAADALNEARDQVFKVYVRRPSYPGSSGQ